MTQPRTAVAASPRGGTQRRTRRVGWKALGFASLGPMLWKEFVQMRRDRLTLFMMIGVPVVQLLLFGFAIKTEVRHVPTVVLDDSRSSASRALVDVMRNTGNFDIVRQVHTPDAVRDAIDAGDASAALIIPPDYYRDVKRGRTARAQIIVDAADPLGSSAALGAAGSVAQSRTTAPPALDLRLRPWFNPDLRSEAYIVPGLIGVLLSLVMLMITSMAIVRERERGTLEQLIVTPISKTSLMLGKMLPFVLVGYVQVILILVLGKLLFDIPIRGSLPLLFALTLSFIVANLGIGLFISTVVRTQAQAMQLSFFVILPNILLSGFMFPRAAMPALARWLGLALPLTYYLRILRGILLKAIGLEFLWRDALILAAFAFATVAISVIRFSKSIE
jgi:ABC-2 type transport system permease protein